MSEAAIFTVIIAGGGLIMYFVLIYNGLIRLSNNIEKAWANIDVILKQRHDEIPNLVRVCEGYMKYEKDALLRITQARTACLNTNSVGESSLAESGLTQALKTLFAVAEKYPELKANNNFMHLQNRVSYLEGQIADRREFYNDSVNNYNIRINQIPDTFVARSCCMKEKEMFKINPEERSNVNV